MWVYPGTMSKERGIPIQEQALGLETVSMMLLAYKHRFFNYFQLCNRSVFCWSWMEEPLCLDKDFEWVDQGQAMTVLYGGFIYLCS